VLARRLRLIFGLILFVYVGTHQLNHALGLISLEALETGRLVFLAFWRGPIGTLLLYPALLGHVNLVLWQLYRRRFLRMPRLELFRLVLGLAMPVLLTPHIFATRGANELYGLDDTYALVAGGMFVQHLDSAFVQSLLMLIAWIHGCMGVHWWLSLKPWYPRWRPWLGALALLLPTLSLIGFFHAGREYLRLARDPAWVAATFTPEAEHQMAVMLSWSAIASAVFVATVAAAFGGRWLRDYLNRRRGTIRLRYPPSRMVTVPVGTSVLDASRSAGIPHASLCGGRGRCSTCRVRIGQGLRRLAQPLVDEQRVLRRVAAPPNVRLACQLHPTVDLEVFPLLPAAVSVTESFLRPSYSQGTESEIAILFADIRSFTQLSEHRLPYDVVFMLNQYFASMGEAIQSAGGHLDKFIGDGIMALFGIDGDPRAGCRQALVAAANMASALESLNRTLEHDLAEPLRIGIGIHAGHVIVGEMGYRPAWGLTAIGDAVNTASRLESMTKEFHSQLVVSDDVAVQAGVDLSRFPMHTIQVRGRSSLLAIYALDDARHLSPILESAASART
jgi:adenylate cyclase